MSDDLAPEALDALAALEKAATPGPWAERRYGTRWTHGHGEVWELVHPQDGIHPANVIKARGAEHAADQCCWPPTESDAALIAALRNAAPALIAAARDQAFLLTAVRSLTAERDAARAEVADLREDNDRLVATLTNRERDRADRLAEEAELGDVGVCRTCVQPIWFEEGEVGHLKRVGWSDRIKQGGDSLVCFRAIHYRHAPMVDRERAIWDAATKAALTTGGDRG